jgi:hypothetical protein
MVINGSGVRSDPALTGGLRVRWVAFYNQSGSSGTTEKFYLDSRNPLKSPDSAKEKQGNPSLFAWFYLVLLAFPWRKFSREVVSAGLAAIRS